MFKKGTWTHSLWRTLVSLIVFSIPLVLLQMPVEWQSMTIGTALMLLAHRAEVYLTQ